MHPDDPAGTFTPESQAAAAGIAARVLSSSGERIEAITWKARRAWERELARQVFDPERTVDQVVTEDSTTPGPTTADGTVAAPPMPGLYVAGEGSNVAPRPDPNARLHAFLRGDIY